MKYLAIDAGGTFVKYAIITQECEILEKGKIPTVREPREAVVKMFVQIYEKYQGEVDGVALSMPGFVDCKTGYQTTGGAFGCMCNANLPELLRDEIDVPITVENDARCAGMAEVWKGALKDCNDGIVMVVGTGIGGAIIRNREVITGSHYAAGELSYLFVNAEKTQEWGNVFGRVNGVAMMVNKVAARKGIPAAELDGEKVFEMANNGDQEVVEEIRSFAHGIAVQAVNLQFITDPEKIAIGGGISVQPLFIELLREEVDKLNSLVPWEVHKPEITACEFTSDANLIGAVYVHLRSREG